MTAVFKISSSGPLENVQLGVVDVVATASAAYSAWGWMGGLQGLQNVFRNVRGYAEHWNTVFSPGVSLPISCRMLTFHGIATFQDDATHAFGGDPVWQMVGVTLCALGYELTRDVTVELFMTTLAAARFLPAFRDIPGAKEALQTQLIDNYKLIQNEGASRGLPRRFDQAISKLHLAGTYQKEPSTVQAKEWVPDSHLVGGFLKWISSQSNSPYFTRSALVTRVAVRLREVGYVIGTITTWSGHGPPPTTPRAVFLTLGGSSETDTYVDREHGRRTFPRTSIISHYHYDTVGGMLFNTLRTPGQLQPEPLQDYFDSVHSDIEQRLSFRWTVENIVDDMNYSQGQQIKATAERKSPPRSSSIAIRLSSFYFAQCAEFLAPCYERIATQDTLDVVKKQIKLKPHNAQLGRSLVEFRTITASIIIAVIGQLGGKNFKFLRHSTRISLQYPLEGIARNVETLLTSGLSFQHVAAALAYIHAGYNAAPTEQQMNYDDLILLDYQVIGFRDGCYAVLPALLSHMGEGPSETVIGFECFDEFLANIPTQPDGKVVSSAHRAVSQDIRDHETLQSVLAAESLHQSSNTAQIESAMPKATIAVPLPQAPDLPLYLNIERSLNHDSPVLSLCGRVHGSAVGHIGVYSILTTIVSSLQEQSGQAHACCTRRSKEHTPNDLAVHDSHCPPSGCLIVPASVWCKTEVKICGKPGLNVYIPVHGDAAWALFLAGEIASRICWGCVSCTETGARSDPELSEENGFVIIGY